MKKIIVSDQAPKPIGPYSQGIAIGNQFYSSGNIAINPATGELEVGEIQAETRLVLNNMKATVDAAGFTMQDIVKCTIFIKDMDQFSLINEIYGEYFTETPPARECVQVARLPKDVNIEISCIAVKN